MNWLFLFIPVTLALERLLQRVNLHLALGGNFEAGGSVEKKK